MLDSPPERKRGRMRERERGTLLPSVCDRLKLIPPSSGYTHKQTRTHLPSYLTLTYIHHNLITAGGDEKRCEARLAESSRELSENTHTGSKWYILQYTFDNTTLCLCAINISHILLIVVLWDESLNI